jgi:hypothetical protein
LLSAHISDLFLVIIDDGRRRRNITLIQRR